MKTKCYQTTFRNELIKLIKFMKILRIEPYLFLAMFQMALKITPATQLIQDKICLHWYNTTVKYCQDLPSVRETGDMPGHFKSKILADVTQFGILLTYLDFILKS